MKQFILAIIISVLPLILFAEQSPKPFMGINHQIITEMPDFPDAPLLKAAIQVTNVQKSTPAFEYGLLEGDIIFGIDGKMMTTSAEEMQDEFRDLLYLHSPGDMMVLSVMRLDENQSLRLNGKEIDPALYLNDPKRYIAETPDRTDLQFASSKRWIVKDIDLVLGTREEFKLPAVPDISETDLGQYLMSGDDRQLANWEPWVEEVVSRYGITEEYDDLRSRLQGIEAGDDGTRLPAMAEIHRNPFFLERYGRKLTDLLKSNRTEMFRQLFSSPLVAMYLTGNRLEIHNPELMPLPVFSNRQGGFKALSEDEFKSWFEGQMARLIIPVDTAFFVFNKEEREFLMAHRYELSDVHAQGIYLTRDEDEQRFQRNRRTLELGARLDLDLLFRASFNIGRFLANNEGRIFNWMKAHPETRIMETTWGKIGFGTEKYDRWANSDVRYIFDPAGDDFYANGAGTANSFDAPVSWIIDLKGNDAYQSTVDGAQGSGLPGIGILIDREGDDTYIGSRWCQGTGFMGVGVLIDEHGDDEYHGTEFVQGTALFGLGVLADYEGNDCYYGTIHAQGCGFTHGLGMLIDYAGDDRGYSTGKFPTNYGDPGIFDAWSQGCGMGFRGVASGGIGVLLDVKGEDKWEAGNFSQGGGYYYGLGIFRAAGKEDDIYIGSRYGQGFCAHQAAGLFIEDGGDDFYTTRQSVVTGLAWDECVTVFIDESGNDYYNGGGGFSLGAAAHNSFCFFLDKRGKDTYDYQPGPARAGGNDYHGGSSFSMFVDQGRQKDVYTSDRVRNDVELVWKEYGVFRDGKGVLMSPLEKPEE